MLPCRAAHGNNGTTGTRRGSNGRLKVETTVLRSEGTFSFSSAESNDELHELTASLASKGAGECKYEWNKRISLSWMSQFCDECNLLFEISQKERNHGRIYLRKRIRATLTITKKTKKKKKKEKELRQFWLFFSLSFDLTHSILKLILKLKSNASIERNKWSSGLIRGTPHCVCCFLHDKALSFTTEHWRKKKKKREEKKESRK